MFVSHNKLVWVGSFFCLFGWVYSGSATLAADRDQTNGVGRVSTVTFAAPKPVEDPDKVTEAFDPTSVTDDAPAEAQAEPTDADNPTATDADANADKNADGPETIEAEPANDKAPSLFEVPNDDIETDDQATGVKAVKVGTFGQIDLHVKDLDITKVLQLLSIQSQRNVVASRNVAGVVSADLYGVDFYEALDAILQPNGFGYREKGNFIYVYTAEELKTLQDAEKKVTTTVLRLNYIAAKDAATFVTPLLSSAGAIAISGDTVTGFQPTISDAGGDSFAHGATLVVRDYPENVEEIEKVLGDLDKRPAQVMIESTILQARLTEENAWGVDLTLLANFAFDEFTSGPAGVIDDLIAGDVGPDGSAISTSPGQVSSGNSSVRIGILDENVAAFVKALDAVTDTTVIAKPKLLVLNRMGADLLVGERLGYLSTSATETSTTQTVEFLDVGTQLTVRPFVSNDGFIRMEIRPSVSDGDTVLAGGLVIPNQTTQELTTNVMMRNGQTIVLGGLFKEDTTISRRQVPGFGDLPIVGAAFKGHDDNVSRSEVIFMLTPTVVKDEALYAMGERATESIEYAMIGARQGLLPWSRSKVTSGHMRDAQAHMAAGDKDKALWSVNMALNLDPTYNEAQRLKSQLTDTHVAPLQRSLLEDAMHTLIEEQKKAADAGDDKADDTADENAADAQTADADQSPATEDDPMPGIGDVPVVPALDIPVDGTPGIEPVAPAPNNDEDVFKSFGELLPDGDNNTTDENTTPESNDNITPEPDGDAEENINPSDAANDTPADQDTGDEPTENIESDTDTETNSDTNTTEEFDSIETETIEPTEDVNE